MELEPATGTRLDRALAQKVPADLALSRTRISALIKEGHVTDARTGEVLRDPSVLIRGARDVDVEIPPPTVADVQPMAMDLEIVHEDSVLLVVNKPRGMVVHPGAGIATGTLVNGLLHHCRGSLSGIGGEARPGIVHRIDKDTSGLLVVAKTDHAHQSLSAQFADHTVHRRYRALVWGVPDTGHPRLIGHPIVSVEPGGILALDAPLARHSRDRKKMAVATKQGKRAVTRAKVDAVFGDAAAEAVLWLETGRTHQIRVHMAHIGHPLVGDAVYGRARALPGHLDTASRKTIGNFSGQALHAAELGFIHPETAQKIKFSVLPPDEYFSLRDALQSGFGGQKK